jgi:hypothetical protein
MFGTFREEDERCVYGTRGELRSWDPLWANAEVYWALARDSWHARNWADKLRVWLKPPGWRPADVAARFPKPAFDIAQVTRYEPVVPGGVQWFAGVQFLLLLVGVAVFLWFADAVALPRAAVWLAALTAALWAVGGVLQGRLSVTEVLLVEAAALATAGAALGLDGLHHVCKPLALAIAIFLAARRAMARGGVTAFDGLLLAGLVASLVGDVLLMGPAKLFVPGLVCFLLAHLAYIALLRIGVGLFPRRGALAATLLIGVGMYAFLWQGGLPAALADSGRGVRGRDRVHGGAGDRAGRGAARPRPGCDVGGGGRVLLHAERRAAGHEPLRDAAAAGFVVGAGDVLRGADIDRAARAPGRLSSTCSLPCRGRVGVGQAAHPRGALPAPIPAFPQRGKEQDRSQH